MVAKPEAKVSEEPAPSRAHLTFRQGMDETQINRELLTKMMSLSEIIRNLSEENESLRQENVRVREVRKEAKSQEIQEMEGVVMSYQRQAKEMAERIQDLERQVAEAQTEALTNNEKSKYKQLARRLKEERNVAKEQLAKKTAEQQEVKEEMERMAFLVKDLRMQCDKLQKEVTDKNKELKDAEMQADLDEEDDSGYRSSIPCQSSYCSPSKETADACVQWEEDNREDLLSSPASSSLSPDFRLATPAGLGPTPRLVDSGLLVQVDMKDMESMINISMCRRSKSGRRRSRSSRRRLWATRQGSLWSRHSRCSVQNREEKLITKSRKDTHCSKKKRRRTR